MSYLENQSGLAARHFGKEIKKGYSTVYTAEMDEKNREFMLFHDDATGGL